MKITFLLRYQIQQVVNLISKKDCLLQQKIIKNIMASEQKVFYES